MKSPRIIKRYHNRKLYDVLSSSYVTLEDISVLIKRGDEVQIINNATNRDITGQTLAQIIFEEEKKKKSFLPLETFRTLIQSGGQTIRDLVQSEFTHVKSFVEEKVKPTLENVQNIPAVKHEIEALRSRIEALEKKKTKRSKF